MSTATKPIHPNNAYLVRQSLTKYDATTNTYIPWTGAATISASFYEDAFGVTPIAGLTGIAMAESAVLGTYYVVVSGTLTATLTSYDGQTIYLVVTGGVQSDLRVVVPLLVTDPRYALLGE